MSCLSQLPFIHPTVILGSSTEVLDDRLLVRVRYAATTPKPVAALLRAKAPKQYELDFFATRQNCLSPVAVPSTVEARVRQLFDVSFLYGSALFSVAVFDQTATAF